MADKTEIQSRPLRFVHQLVYRLHLVNLSAALPQKLNGSFVVLRALARQRKETLAHSIDEGSLAGRLANKPSGGNVNHVARTQ